jgi:hypothetical protein
MTAFLLIWICLTGVLGFEPRNGGTKTRCLTAWLHPNVVALTMLTVNIHSLSSIFSMFARSPLSVISYQ